MKAWFRLSFLCMSLAGAAWGCGGDSDDDAPAADAANPTPDGPVASDPDAAPPPPGSVSIEFGPIAQVGPGVENTQCIIKRLSNTEELRVNQIHNTLGDASHHMIVYRLNTDQERLEPFDCDPFIETLNPDNGSPLAVTQRADELITLPPGVAYTLAPNQMIRIEMHYINTSDTPKDIMGSTTFIPIAESAYEHEADFLFIGNPDITLPPMQETVLGPTYFPLPDELAGVTIFAITGHEHRFGTRVHVALASPGAEDQTVYDPDPFLWDEPETTYHDPPFAIPDGGGFRFTCEWNNTSGDTVDFGESANQEMCFFWAYYYPSVGSRTCVHTDQFGTWDICCPGHFICDQIQNL